MAVKTAGRRRAQRNRNSKSTDAINIGVWSEIVKEIYSFRSPHMPSLKGLELWEDRYPALTRWANYSSALRALICFAIGLTYRILCPKRNAAHLTVFTQGFRAGLSFVVVTRDLPLRAKTEMRCTSVVVSVGWRDLDDQR